MINIGKRTLMQTCSTPKGRSDHRIDQRNDRREGRIDEAVMDGSDTEGYRLGHFHPEHDQLQIECDTPRGIDIVTNADDATFLCFLILQRRHGNVPIGSPLKKFFNTHG